MSQSAARGLLLFITMGILLPSLARAHAGDGDNGSFMHAMDHLEPVFAMLVMALPCVASIVIALGMKLLFVMRKKFGAKRIFT